MPPSLMLPSISVSVVATKLFMDIFQFPSLKYSILPFHLSILLASIFTIFNLGDSSISNMPLVLDFYSDNFNLNRQ